MRLTKNAVVHTRVASVCHELANTIFENMSYDNKFYGVIKEINQALEDRKVDTTLSAKDLFIRALAPQLREVAIRILANMLEDPSIDSETKQEIFEAIMLDKTIPEHSSMH